MMNPKKLIVLKLALKQRAAGTLSAKKETADGLCVEYFTSPAPQPGQCSPVYGSNLLFLFADKIHFTHIITFFVFTVELGGTKV